MERRGTRISRPLQRHWNNTLDAARPCRNDHHPIRERNGLINAVRHEEDRCFAVPPHVDEEIL